MSSAKHRELVTRLKETTDALVQDASEFEVLEERTAKVVDAVREILEDGLEGNRSLRPFIWNVVRRVGRACPLTLHSSIDKVRALARKDVLDREQVEEAWIKQALHEGVLSSLLTNIVKQFQIRSAYLSDAVVCDRVWRLEIIEILDQLQGVIKPVPDAPSVSSWSSEDSFICSPRSTEVDPVFGAATSRTPSGKGQSGRRSDESAGSELLSQRSAGTSRSGETVEGKRAEDTARSPAVIDTAVDSPASGSRFETRRSHSGDSLQVKASEHTSFFGLFSRTLSGSMHSTSSADSRHKGSPASTLSHEEQISRFWSRCRSESGSAGSLLREVEKDIGTKQTTPVTPDERAKASQTLVKELHRVGRLVLQQYCSNGLPLSVDVYPLSKIFHLFEEAFTVGLRPCPLFQPNVPNMQLAQFEKIMPKGNATPYAVLAALQTVYPHEKLGIALELDASTTESAFQRWLKTRLIDCCLAGKIETVLKYQDFLQGWYHPQAIVTNEDQIQELIVTCRGLEAIAIEGAQVQKSARRSSRPSLDKLLSGDDVTVDLARLPPEAVTKHVNDNNSDDVWLSARNGGMNEINRELTYGSVGELSNEEKQGTQSERKGTHSAGKKTLLPPCQPISTECLPSSSANTPFRWNSSGEIPETVLSKHDLPMYKQIALASANVPNLRVESCDCGLQSGRLRPGDTPRIPAGHHTRTMSVVSSCISGEDEDDWRGVWKDVDVVRFEIGTGSTGEQYVAYAIEIMASDGTHWQTARRFSDLVNLKKSLLKQDVELPHSWTNLSKARVVTGKKRFSDEIVEARSVMIRQCLWDLMTGFPESLIWTSVAEFLDAPLSLLRGTKSRQRTGSCSDDRIKSLIYDRINNHLNRMALIVDLPLQVPDEVVFEIQNGLCAGCQAFLPPITHQKTLFRTSQSPRKCAYTELLYCHRCHQLDTAFLPSRVLHCWDFAKYSVSVSAKSYLYSIFLSPVLCINAVNPGLLASVPTLAHLEHLRQRIAGQMDQLRNKGPDGRRIALSIEESAGPNKHLVQNADYWSMKDLGDISRGIFARLPRWLEAVNKQVEKVVEMHWKAVGM